MRRSVCVLLTLAVVLVGGSRTFAAPMQWSVSDGGNDHWYEVIHSPSTTWEGCRVLAESLSYLGMPGYLATVTTETENAWVTQNLLRPSPYGALAIGGFQPPGSPEPAGGWQWVTGEPWGYTNWAGAPPSQEPNDLGGEDRLNIWGGGWGPRFSTGEDRCGTWNDVLANYPNMEAYVVEYSGAVPEPSTLLVWSGLSAMGLIAAWRRRKRTA